jgi:glycosyltransferase involved in cell wall biosynthesis
MTVLEAMACGKPVIASRIGGIPEQVVHDRTGVLFEPGNAAELTAAIRSLMANPRRREEMGRAARDRVEACFSLDRHGEGLMELYKEVVRV